MLSLVVVINKLPGDKTHPIILDRLSY